MTVCGECVAEITDPVDAWPGRDKDAADICTDCWERRSSASWWETCAAAQECRDDINASKRIDS